MAAQSSVSLADSAVLDLSKRIISEAELVELGVNLLKLPEYTIQAALHDKKKIQSATYELLRTWLHAQTDRQTDRREAYTVLNAALRAAGMHQLVGLLRQWVEGCQVASAEMTPERTSISENSMSQTKRLKRLIEICHSICRKIYNSQE